MNPRRYLFLFVVLIVSFPLVSPRNPIPARGDFSIPPLGLPTDSSRYGKVSLLDAEGLWVVRAYFSDRSQVTELARYREPWEVQYEKGYLVLDVDRWEYAWLEGLGFNLEIDPLLTAQLQSPPTYLPAQTSGIPGYPCYRTVEETYAAAQNLATQHPQLATWSDIGDTWEKVTPSGPAGFDLFVLRLTNSQIPGPKPKLFVMSALHAREYATAELSTRFAEYLLDNYNHDPDVTWLLDDHEIHLLLQSNPDGRKKAEAGLLWRKNTNNNYCSDSTSRGADLNRNFEFQWACCGGSSSSQCSEVYRGPAAGSEPEVQAIQDYVRSQFPDQRGDPLDAPAPPDTSGIFLDIHSYGELVLWPWGFGYQLPPNATGLQTLGRKLAYFNGYTPEQSIHLYPTDGASDDFAYGELGLAAYTVELGTAFFQGCSSFENNILPTNLQALLYAAKAARTPYLAPAGPDAYAVTASPAGVAAGAPVQLSATLSDRRYNNSNGSEPIQNIAAAEVYLDIPPWQTGSAPQPITLSPADGTYDQTIEMVSGTLDTHDLSAGRHTIYVRGQDAAGNWGPVSATFLVLLDPATSPRFAGVVRQAGSLAPLAATIQAGIFTTATLPADGSYLLPVTAGSYNLQVTAPGHLPATASGLVISDSITLNQDFALQPLCTTAANNAESGAAGWNAGGPWDLTSEAYHSPTHAWTDSPDQLYQNNVDAYLTSPVLDLSYYQNVALDFWHIYDMEPGSNPRYDYGAVEISTNGGANWQEAAYYTGYDQFDWRQVHLALPMLDGVAQARLRFHFHSDGGINADGWYLDDITLTGASLHCADWPFVQNLPFVTASTVNP